MEAATRRTRLMLDPSFVFSEDGIAWLQQLDDRAAVTISATLGYLLETGEDGEGLATLVAPEDLDAFEERRAVLSQLLSATPRFSWEEASLEAPEEDVRANLLESGGVAGTIYADEWAFLHSQSWALSKLHRPLDAFRDAGAAVIEYGRKLRDEMIAVVIPQRSIPPAVTPELLARSAGKWLIVGGVGAGGASLGPVGGGLAALAIPVVRAFDP